MCGCASALARALLAFLDAALLRCFHSLFRPRPRRGAPVPRDRLQDLLSAAGADQAAAYESCASSRSSSEDFTHAPAIHDELRREANYLMLCGTISETPVELRNESHEIFLENKCDNIASKSPATKCIALHEAKSSEGCKGEEHHNTKPELKSEVIQHCIGVNHSAIPETTPFQNSKHKLPDRSGSPFPTPLILRDDMQTPGTIYTSHRGPSMSGKRVRTQKQFVYPVLNPIENRIRQMELVEVSSPLPSSNPPKGRDFGADSIKKQKQTSSASVAKPGLFKKSPSVSSPDDNGSYQVKEALSLEETKYQISSVDTGELSKSSLDEKHAGLSLSHWLNPSSADVQNQGDAKCAEGDQSYDECSFLAEDPVFMASDLKDVENPTPRLPKTWDGNGIPNTTSRYKEDQKVSWHTTPFEERLLKVLAEEEVHQPWKRGKLFDLHEKA
ncbi:hypothetical protein ACP4OV_013851 [Aristida adscensionis]